MPACLRFPGAWPGKNWTAISLISTSRVFRSTSPFSSIGWATECRPVVPGHAAPSTNSMFSLRMTKVKMSAVRPATKAVKAIVLGEYDKRRRLLGVERAEAGQRAPGLAQVNALAYGVDQAQAVLYLLGRTAIHHLTAPFVHWALATLASVV